ncbi:MAG: OmpW family outer membrane protein [Bacteroidota bacterium]
MKKIVIIICFGLITMSTQAQFNVGVTIGPQIPLGSMSDAMKIGFGFNIAGKYMVNQQIGVGLNIGYSSFGSTPITYQGQVVSTTLTSSGSAVPITALFEYHIGKGKFKPYVGADLGLYNFSHTYNSESGLNGSSIPVSFSKMYFGFAPTAGALFELNNKFSLCANLKYNFIASTGGSSTYMGINIGAFYKIK